MRAGDELGGRFRLEAPLPTPDGVARFRATDLQSGREVEVLSLGAARSNADDRRAFRDVHREMRGARAGSAVPTIAVEHAETEAWAARPRLAEPTLADLAGPLEAEIVAAIGARLLPAVTGSGAATRGALLPTDIALDEAGRPVLAPRGAPLNQVVRGTTRAVAPEVLAGGPPDAASGLYGLGVALYRLATGREPTLGTSGAPPAPPSAVRHGIPPALDRAILALLSSDPAARAGALPLLQEVAGGRPASELERFVRARANLGEVNVTVSPSSSSRPGGPTRRREVPRAMVIVPHRELSRLDPGARHAAAGLAGVSLDVVDEAIDERLPLVISGHALQVEAERDAASWRERAGVPTAAGVADAGRAMWLPLLAAVAIGLPLGLLTLVLALFGGLSLAVPAGLAFAADVAFGVATWLIVQRRAADWGRSSEAWRLVTDHRRSRTELGLGPVSEDLAALRRQLAAADLPPAAASDLRSVLKEVDERITALAARAEASAGALRQVDATGLRARLGVLLGVTEPDRDQVAERDRLARIIADLDEVSALRDAVATEASRLRDALAEVATVLGRVGDDDDAIADLGRGARRVEEAVRDDPEADDEAVRRRDQLIAQARAERTTR